MNTTDQLEWLLRHGVIEVTIVGNASRIELVQAKQIVPVGGQGNQTNLLHQVNGPSLAECLNKLADLVLHADQKRDGGDSKNIVPLKRN